ATIMSTIGFAAMSTLIATSRYHADRARMYSDVREARDAANHRLRAVEIVGGASGAVHFIPVLQCTGLGIRGGGGGGSGDIPDSHLSMTTTYYPSIDTNALDALKPVCIDGALAHVTGPLAPAPLGNFGTMLDFGPAHDPAQRDAIVVNEDGRLKDSWNEFPHEGSLEASS